MVVIAVAIAIAAVGIVSSVQSYGDEKRAVRADRAKLARDTAVEASSLVAIRLEYLSGIAASGPVVDADRPAMQSLFRAMLGRRLVVDGIGWVRADGNGVVVTGSSPVNTEAVDLSDRKYVQAVRDEKAVRQRRDPLEPEPTRRSSCSRFRPSTANTASTASSPASSASANCVPPFGRCGSATRSDRRPRGPRRCRRRPDGHAAPRRQRRAPAGAAGVRKRHPRGRCRPERAERRAGRLRRLSRHALDRRRQRAGLVRLRPGAQHSRSTTSSAGSASSSRSRRSPSSAAACSTLDPPARDADGRLRRRREPDDAATTVSEIAEIYNEAVRKALGSISATVAVVQQNEIVPFFAPETRNEELWRRLPWESPLGAAIVTRSRVRADRRMRSASASRRSSTASRGPGQDQRDLRRPVPARGLSVAAPARSSRRPGGWESRSGCCSRRTRTRSRPRSTAPQLYEAERTQRLRAEEAERREHAVATRLQQALLPEGSSRPAADGGGPVPAGDGAPRRSAATGTTRSLATAAVSRSRSATSRVTASTPRRRWDGSEARSRPSHRPSRRPAPCSAQLEVFAPASPSSTSSPSATRARPGDGKDRLRLRRAPSRSSSSTPRAPPSSSTRAFAALPGPGAATDRARHDRLGITPRPLPLRRPRGAEGRLADTGLARLADWARGLRVRAVRGVRRRAPAARPTSAVDADDVALLFVDLNGIGPAERGGMRQ